MKIDDIDAFVAVIRCQSISHAAESLDLTQPAITRRVQNFEQALGVELFDRNTKPLKPTLMGTQVYQKCLAILREMDSLRELVASDTPPSGLLRLGVPQTIGDVVLLDALKQLRGEFPDLRAQVITGWGSHLIGKIENGELDAAAALFPAGKIFPENIVGQSIGKMELVVVCAKGLVPKKLGKLADCYEQGWVLNPDGCGFRAGLQRTLSDQGLSMKVNLETFGTELQLGLVADGMGLGLVPRPLLERSAHCQQLVVLPLKDFKPVMDLWLFYPRFLGNLQAPVEAFGALVARSLKPVSAAA
ncbi:LysR family transcriptional regulator [Pseudomonas syringae pv. helianthi]|uniref:LysR family transcriptional regulator n=2 Tax=Pseudomonas syringae group genomosp. 7 TaxID=251699 RepID=A0A3M6D1I5_9PSED|nr:LysR family transcriptional regulator [Pseudomonas syringae group genomosp. 7]KPY87002.1 LysR family transcriptional regulator [Pseudomonas syringae pv. tagetis]RMR03533.1 LysR family transcriptional regulator [Pseudomonas syringae pv. helianthi]RMV49978.1 LysR family transcriptional regulator [Pseudomonas syringae pv. helianthi]UNB67190.1 LysR family transcriptional regulator [Pseudomonas syringae pv. tagetis]